MSQLKVYKGQCKLKQYRYTKMDLNMKNSRKALLSFIGRNYCVISQKNCCNIAHEFCFQMEDTCAT